MKVDDAVTAFVPGPLPPPIEWSAGLINALSEADRALGGVNSIAGFIPNAGLLVIPFLRIEAVLSSRIENTVTTVEEAFRAAEEPSEDLSGDTQMVINYLAAMDHGMVRLKELPFCLRLVRELHETLLKDVRGEQTAPGIFRKAQVYVGSYTPPPPHLVPDLIGQWELFLQRDDLLPPLVQMSIMHAQFELIHPFLDGNGRIGRLLMSLFLMHRNCLSEPLLFLSQYLEAHRAEYYRRLLAISAHGDWDGWLRFMLEAVRRQADWSLGLGRRILGLRDRLRADLQASRVSPNVLRLLDELFVSPYMTVRRAEKRLDVTYATAGNALAALEGAGIVEEITGRPRNREYVFKELMGLLRGAEHGPDQAQMDL